MARKKKGEAAKKAAKKTAKARGPGNGPTLEELKQFVRREGVGYLHAPNINSVGIGLKIDTKLGQTNKVCIQFTVNQKARPEHLETLRTPLIPPQVNVAG